MNRITLSYVVLVSVACVLSTADSLKAGSGRMEENNVENQPAASSVLYTLLQLNLDYIQSVQTSDVSVSDRFCPTIFAAPSPTGRLWTKRASWSSQHSQTRSQASKPKTSRFGSWATLQSSTRARCIRRQTGAQARGAIPMSGHDGMTDGSLCQLTSPATETNSAMASPTA